MLSLDLGQRALWNKHSKIVSERRTSQITLVAVATTELKHVFRKKKGNWLFLQSYWGYLIFCFCRNVYKVVLFVVCDISKIASKSLDLTSTFGGSC